MNHRGAVRRGTQCGQCHGAAAVGRPQAHAPLFTLTHLVAMLDCPCTTHCTRFLCTMSDLTSQDPAHAACTLNPHISPMSVLFILVPSANLVPGLHCGQACVPVPVPARRCKPLLTACTLVRSFFEGNAFPCMHKLATCDASSMSTKTSVFLCEKL